MTVGDMEFYDIKGIDQEIKNKFPTRIMRATLYSDRLSQNINFRSIGPFQQQGYTSIKAGTIPCTVTHSGLGNNKYAILATIPHTHTYTEEEKYYGVVEFFNNDSRIANTATGSLYTIVSDSVCYSNNVPSTHSMYLYRQSSSTWYVIDSKARCANTADSVTLSYPVILPYNIGLFTGYGLL